MTEAQAVEAIFAAWSTAWSALHPTFELVLGNEAASTEPRWTRTTVVVTTRQQVTMGPPGSRRFEVSGYIAAQIYVPINEGDAELRGLADDARKILESTTLPQRDGSGNVLAGGETVDTFGAPTANVATDGQWYYATLPVPFLFWETR